MVAASAKKLASTIRWQKKNPEKVLATSKRKRDRSRAFVNSFKKPCINCGESDVRCIDFHHRIPEDKSFNLSRSFCHSRADILLEILKCDCLCANCHRKEHITII